MSSLLAELRARSFGLYWSVGFTSVALSTVALVAVTPRLPTRRQLVRQAARTVFRLGGMPLEVSGLEHLPNESCIVVANHASYLDGIILTAALPPRFGFVIKREMTRVPLAHFLLRRIGSEFVERFDSHRSAVDTRRLLQRAGARESLAFFPEGTFRREPGLGRFQPGAFAIAARSGMPVVPVVIRGSRHVLPAERLLPRPGPLQVIVGPPLAPPGDASPMSLLAEARARILANLGEPDLAPGPR